MDLGCFRGAIGHQLSSSRARVIHSRSLDVGSKHSKCIARYLASKATRRDERVVFRNQRVGFISIVARDGGMSSSGPAFEAEDANLTALYG